MTALLGLIHGLDFLLTSFLIGVVVFHTLISKAGGPESASLSLNWPRRVATLIFLTFLSSLTWMLFTANDMVESWQPNDLWVAMSQTRFGHTWCFRLVLLFLLFIGIRFVKKSRMRTLGFMCLTLLVPIFSSLSGHAGANEKQLFLHVAIDWGHSVAVGIWTGGLWALRAWLGNRIASNHFGIESGRLVVKRFSEFAMASTAVIMVTGIVMTYFAGVSFRHPWETNYGALVLGKLLLFCAALVAAAINQFLHLRKWDIENDRRATLSVRREVTLELVFIVIIFGVAGFLTRAALPVG